MPFLSLNGITIPTEISTGGLDHQEFGFRKPSFLGARQIETRARKRVWTFRTRPLSSEAAYSLRQLIQGAGLSLPLDADAYAANGVAPTSGSILSTMRPGYGADGVRSYDENGLTESFLGTGSFQGESASVGNANLLTTAQAQASATASFTANSGSTLTLDASNYWEGTTSIKVLTAAPADSGILTATAFTGSLSRTYFGSAYVKGITAGTVKIRIIDTANGSVGATSAAVTLSTTKWQRVQVSYTTVGAGSTPTLKLLVFNDVGVGGVQFYVDGLMLNTPFSATWRLPGTPSSNNTLSYPFAIGPSGFTVNFWQGPFFSTSLIATQTLVSGALSGGAFAFAVDVVAGPNVRFRTANNNPSVTLGAVGWHMLTIVYRVNPSASQVRKALYFDGVLAGTNNAGSGVIATGTINKFYVGSSIGASQWPHSRTDEVLALPYPIDATTVASLYTQTSAYPLPWLVASGTFQDSPSLIVEGEVTRETYVATQGASAWEPNQKQLDFRLYEA